MGITLLSGMDEWWEVTSLFWLASVATVFAIFCINVVFYEMRACFEVMKNYRHDDDDDVMPPK